MAIFNEDEYYFVTKVCVSLCTVLAWLANIPNIPSQTHRRHPLAIFKLLFDIACIPIYYIRVHSSEIGGLYSTKCFSETI